MFYSLDCIKKVAAQTNNVILFHSANGKDSIALLDMCYPYFKKIVCVYMYMVKDLDHINAYISWAKAKYPTIEFMQVPHYVLSQYIRDGYMGITPDRTQRVYQLKNIVEMTKKNTGIAWAIFGFKQSDSMNRRLMLRSYADEHICEPTKNAYPLSKYKNKDVLAYIKHRKLIQPTKYGNGQSQGNDVTNLPFLMYCRWNYPNDYKKIIAVFPDAERIVFEYENSLKNE